MPPTRFLPPRRRYRRPDSAAGTIRLCLAGREPTDVHPAAGDTLGRLGHPAVALVARAISEAASRAKRRGDDAPSDRPAPGYGSGGSRIAGKSRHHRLQRGIPLHRRRADARDRPAAATHHSRTHGPQHGTGAYARGLGSERGAERSGAPGDAGRPCDTRRFGIPRGSATGQRSGGAGFVGHLRHYADRAGDRLWLYSLRSRVGGCRHSARSRGLRREAGPADRAALSRRRPIPLEQRHLHDDRIGLAGRDRALPRRYPRSLPRRPGGGAAGPDFPARSTGKRSRPAPPTRSTTP